MDTLGEDEAMDGETDNRPARLGSIDTSNHEPDYTDAHHILHALADGMCGVSMVVRPEHGIVLGMQHIVPVDQLLAYADPDIRRSAMITFTDLLNSGSDQSWIWGNSGVAQRLYQKFLVFLHPKYEHCVVESACLAIAALVSHQPSHARGVLHPQSLAIFLVRGHHPQTPPKHPTSLPPTHPTPTPQRPRPSPPPQQLQPLMLLTPTFL